MKRFLAVILSIIILAPAFGFTVSAAEFTAVSDAKSLILIEAETGTVIYEKNADLTLSPASVTKVMTILLIMEAIAKGLIEFEDEVTVSAYAASMGGSQVFLSPGEVMTVHDLLKSIIISSANDACVAMAEHISGSEESFVAVMNARAVELGMTLTNFENSTGLDDTTRNHVTTARDISIMSAELISNYPKVLEFSSIWMDSIRDGEFGLTNTNRLVRFYQGANGLKTGSTSKAKFCISASAKRDGMQLICVVMGADTRDSRNEIAKKLFDFGFANYTYEYLGCNPLDELLVLGGKKDSLALYYECYDFVTDKANSGKTNSEITLPESVQAPIKAGDVIGKVTYTLNGETVAEIPIVAAETVEKITFFELFKKLLDKFWY